MHWVNIGGAYINLDEIVTIRVGDSAVQLEGSTVYTMPKSSPGTASFLDYLNKCCGTAKFDAESDAALETSPSTVYKVGDVVSYRKHDDDEIKSGVISHVVMLDDFKTADHYILDTAVIVLPNHIIGLAPPETESEAHE